MLVFSVGWDPLLNILVWKVTMPQCWLFRVVEPMPQCLGAKGQYTWILVIWNGGNPCMNVLSIKVYQSYVNWLGVKNWIFEREKVITFECWLFVMVGTISNCTPPPSSLICIRPISPLPLDGHHLGTCHLGTFYRPVIWLILSMFFILWSNSYQTTCTSLWWLL